MDTLVPLEHGEEKLRLSQVKRSIKEIERKSKRGEDEEKGRQEGERESKREGKKRRSRTFFSLSLSLSDTLYLLVGVFHDGSADAQVNQWGLDALSRWTGDVDDALGAIYSGKRETQRQVDERETEGQIEREERRETV